jgi:hypothetical protein
MVAPSNHGAEVYEFYRERAQTLKAEADDPPLSPARADLARASAALVAAIAGLARTLLGELRGLAPARLSPGV